MKLFVDTGNLKEIEALAAIGILDGVTTNPSLLAKESGDYRQIVKQICQTVHGPVSEEGGGRGVQELRVERHMRQRDVDLRWDAGGAGGEGRRGLGGAVRRSRR